MKWKKLSDYASKLCSNIINAYIYTEDDGTYVLDCPIFNCYDIELKSLILEQAEKEAETIFRKELDSREQYLIKLEQEISK